MSIAKNKNTYLLHGYNARINSPTLIPTTKSYLPEIGICFDSSHGRYYCKAIDKLAKTNKKGGGP
jgi:hypothetical protein